MGAMPLPRATERAVQQFARQSEGSHPGLLLDRFVEYDVDGFEAFNQETQLNHLRKVAISHRAHADQADGLLARWEDIVTGVGATTWSQTTVWRLATHLARPIALENASICLHPIYGFPYLPGTGLKGMTQAYWELYCTEDAEPEEAEQAGRVFGSLEKAGSVVFLDAWPEVWPVIEPDITNSHHRDYYGSEGGKPPGDWESPVPVYFLTVAPGAVFRFGVAPRAAGLDHVESDVEAAASWVKCALSELGFGAKTAAGYGYFEQFAPEGDNTDGA